jgi:hypothetical protein
MTESLEVQKGHWRATLKQVLGDDRRFAKTASTNESLRWLLDNLDQVVDSAVARQGRINQAAAELRSQDPSLTEEGAIAKVFTAHPELITEYRDRVEKLGSGRVNRTDPSKLNRDVVDGTT